MLDNSSLNADDVSLIAIIAWTLVHAIWQGALAWLVYTLARRITNSARLRTRFANWSLVGLLIAQAITVAVLIIRPVQVPTFTRFLVNTADYPTPRVVRPDGKLLAEPRPMPAPPPLAGWTSAATPALPWIFGLWAAFVGARLIAIGRGWKALDRAISDARPVPDDVAAKLDPLGGMVELRRAVAFVTSPEVALPAVARWRRPVVLLPVDEADNPFEPQELRALVLHELAHVARGDFITTLARSVLLSLYYFHPSLHAICRSAIHDSEEATDDLASRAFGDRYGYTTAFASSAARMVHEPTLTFPAVRRAGGGGFVQRVARLTRMSATELEDTRETIAAGVGAAVMTFVFLGAFFLSAADAIHRERLWVQSRSIGRAAIETLTNDRENPALDAAMRNAIAELRAVRARDESTVDAVALPDLDLLAAELLNGVPVTRLEREVTHRLMDGRAARPGGLDLGDYGTTIERRLLCERMIRAVESEPASERRRRLARGAVLLGAITTLPGGRDAVTPLQNVAIYDASGLLSEVQHRLYLALCQYIANANETRQVATLTPAAFNARLPELLRAFENDPAAQMQWRRAADPEQVELATRAIRDLPMPERFAFMLAPPTTPPKPQPTRRGPATTSSPEGRKLIFVAPTSTAPVDDGTAGPNRRTNSLSR